MGMMFTDSLNYDMQGRRRKKKAIKGDVYKKYQPEWKPLQSSPGPYRRDEGVVYRSMSVTNTAGDTSRKEPQKYTGTLVKGISTMHKSNAVPIIDEREAKEHASMRR